MRIPEFPEGWNTSETVGDSYSEKEPEEEMESMRGAARGRRDGRRKERREGSKEGEETKRVFLSTMLWTVYKATECSRQVVVRACSSWA